MGKVPIFKPQIGKMFFGQTTGGQSVISPILNLKLIISKILSKTFIVATFLLSHINVAF